MVAVVTALAIGGVVTTSAGAATPRAATPANVVHHATTKAHALATPGFKRVQSIALPPGAWSIFAEAGATDTGATDVFRCELMYSGSATTVLDTASTQLSPGIAHDTITNALVFTTLRSYTITQLCGHDGDAGDAGSIDPGASIVAFDAAPSNRVRITRTLGATSLPNGVSVGVANLSLTKGNWVVAVKASAVDPTANAASVECTFGSSGEEFGRVLGPAASGMHGVSTILDVQSLAVATGTTYKLSCETFTDGVHLDKDAVVWAWKANHLVSAKSAAADACPLRARLGAPADALVLDQSACAVGVGTYPTELVGAQLGAGTWVGIGAVDAIAGRESNVAHCQLFDGRRRRQVDAASATLVGTDGAQFTTGITNLGVVAFPKGGAVEGRCGQDSTGADANAGHSGWAFIRP